MKILKKGTFIYLLLFVLSSCQKQKDLRLKAEKSLEKLKDNQAKVVIQVGGKEFYSDSSLFTGQVMLTDQMLSFSLIDQFDGRTMLNIGGDKWYSQNPIKRELILREAFNASLKLGKMVDVERGIGRGYMMTEGTIEAISFGPDNMIFSISGKAAKYSDFEAPNTYLALEGYIVYKKPAISFSNIKEDEVFRSIQSNQ